MYSKFSQSCPITDADEKKSIFQLNFLHDFLMRNLISALARSSLRDELGIPLGQGDLPLLLGEEPLLAGLVGLGVGGQMVPQLAASHNLCWALANVPQKSVPVVQESPGKFVIVKAARLVHVVPDQLLGQLHPLLSSEVRVGEVGAGQPVPAALLLEEGLDGGGHIAQAPITGQLLTGSEGLKVMAQYINELI